MSAMGEGNKESAKEILSTYRTLFAIDVSGRFLLANMYVRQEIHIRVPCPFWTGVVLWVLSAMAMIWLFFIVVPKLYDEEADIIYQRSVLIPSMIGFWFFILGYAGIIYGITS
jgi:hypothetical protein